MSPPKKAANGALEWAKTFWLPVLLSLIAGWFSLEAKRTASSVKDDNQTIAVAVAQIQKDLYGKTQPQVKKIEQRVSFLEIGKGVRKGRFSVAQDSSRRGLGGAVTAPFRMGWGWLKGMFSKGDK